MVGVENVNDKKTSSPHLNDELHETMPETCRSSELQSPIPDNSDKEDVKTLTSDNQTNEKADKMSAIHKNEEVRRNTNATTKNEDKEDLTLETKNEVERHAFNGLHYKNDGEEKSTSASLHNEDMEMLTFDILHNEDDDTSMSDTLLSDDMEVPTIDTLHNDDEETSTSDTRLSEDMEVPTFDTLHNDDEEPSTSETLRNGGMEIPTVDILHNDDEEMLTVYDLYNDFEMTFIPHTEAMEVPTLSTHHNEDIQTSTSDDLQNKAVEVSTSEIYETKNVDAPTLGALHNEGVEKSTLDTPHNDDLLTSTPNTLQKIPTVDILHNDDEEMLTVYDLYNDFEMTFIPHIEVSTSDTPKYEDVESSKSDNLENEDLEVSTPDILKDKDTDVPNSANAKILSVFTSNKPTNEEEEPKSDIQKGIIEKPPALPPNIDEILRSMYDNQRKEKLRQIAELEDTRLTQMVGRPSSQYYKLLKAGLLRPVAIAVDNMLKTGKLSPTDMDQKAIDAIKKFQVKDALNILTELLDSNLEHVTNKPAFLCSIIKMYRHKLICGARNPKCRRSQPNASLKYPDEPKVNELIKRTGYTLEITTGQRKYGGPPPNWTGGPPPKGCEIFCGQVPKNIYEDVLVPLFEKYGTIWDLRVMMDPMSGMNRGFIFITFTTNAEAEEAVNGLNGYEIVPGKSLRLRISLPNLRLFIGNIPKAKTREDIKFEFEKLTIGLTQVIIYNSPDDNNENRGFCFLEYDTHKSASVARRRLSTGRVKVWGCDIVVDWADPQEEPDDMTMSKVRIIYVRNIPHNVSEDNIRDIFSKFGILERVKKIKNFAFVHFQRRENASKAIKEMNGIEIYGAKIEVTWSKPPTDKRKRENILRARERRMTKILQTCANVVPPSLAARGLTKKQNCNFLMGPPECRYDYDYYKYDGYRGGYLEPQEDSYLYEEVSGEFLPPPCQEPRAREKMIGRTNFEEASRRLVSTRTPSDVPVANNANLLFTNPHTLH